MKIIVPIKRVIDPYVKIRIASDASGVDLNHVKMAINPFDEIALEEAIRLRESGVATEIIALSIGSQASQEILRQALALGAHRAILIETDVMLESLTIAKLLKAVVHDEQADLVLMGKQAIDDDCNQTGQMLAALLNWPQATFASEIVIHDKTAEVTSEIDGGLQTLRVTLPAVITTDLRLNQPRYASLPNIMKARQKPLQVIQADTLNVDLTPRSRILKVTPPPPRKAGRIVENVTALINALKNEAKVI